MFSILQVWSLDLTIANKRFHIIEKAAAHVDSTTGVIQKDEDDDCSDDEPLDFNVSSYFFA